MKSKPEIYGPEPDCLEFLTETEAAFLEREDDALRKHIQNRAKMFSVLHRLWTEYNPKDKSTRKRTLQEWKKKAYNSLHLQFKMTSEQAKGIIDSYFQKVSMPKGGLMK